MVGKEAVLTPSTSPPLRIGGLGGLSVSLTVRGGAPLVVRRLELTGVGVAESDAPQTLTASQTIVFEVAQTALRAQETG